MSDYDEYDLIDGVGFANRGSALRAAADKTAHMSCEFNPCEHGYADAGDCPMCYEIGMMEIRAQRAEEADKAALNDLIAVVQRVIDLHHETYDDCSPRQEDWERVVADCVAAIRRVKEAK